LRYKTKPERFHHDFSPTIAAFGNDHHQALAGAATGGYGHGTTPLATLGGREGHLTAN
jgi:hypothetical protein